MQQVYGRIQELGAEVFFIGPETRDNAAELMEKEHASIPLLYDREGTVIRSYGLAFDAPEYLRPGLSFIGLPDANPETQWMLPIPATYVIAPDGVVAERYVNADYTYRMEPADVVRALERIAGK